MRNRLAKNATTESTVKIIMGVGSLNSASIGARIVAVRAKVLQMPRVVAVMEAGNKKEFER